MKSTPIATMQKTAVVEPLDYRRNAELLTHGEKVKWMPDHPLHKRPRDLTKNRLKRTSLNHVLIEQQRKQSDILAPRPEECEMLTHNRTPLVLKAEVKFSIPVISTKSSDSEAFLKTLTLAELDKIYPVTAWTQVFTDGSAENATRNGGCGIYIRQPNKPPITIAIPGGDLCSNYRAETQALLTATETITQLATRPKKVVLLTDCLSVLQSLASGNPEDYTLRNLIQSLNSLTSRTTAVLQWIPAHTDIHGNEVADKLAKEGSKKQQLKSKLSYQEAKTLIRKKRLADFKHRNGGYNPQQDTLRLLSRHKQILIFRLRTGHCRLRSHMQNIGGLEAQTTAHVL